MSHYRVGLRDVIAAHDEALTYGGLAGILSLGGIESAIARPYSGYHRKMSQKAAALLEALTQNHGFVDGNKRTALLATLLLIDRSGYDLELIGDEWIDDVVVLVADGKMEFVGLEQWFAKRLTRRKRHTS